VATKKKLVIEVDSKGVPKASRQLDTMTKKAKKAERGTAALTKRMGSMLGPMALATVGIGLMAGALSKMIRNTSIQDAAMAQLRAGLESTGHSAGFTADELAGMAAQMQKTTMFGDEAVIKMQALMLTFTNIKSALPATTWAIADMATRMGTDLTSAAIQLGKALNDPIANLSALSRSGIQFTKSQRELIKGLWETGQQAEAQKVILTELNTQFGGSAKAARDTLGGAIQALSNNFNDLFELGEQSSAFFTRFVKGANSATLAVGGLKSKVADYFDYLRFMENEGLTMSEKLFSTPETREAFAKEQAGKGELKEGTVVGEGQLEDDMQVRLDEDAKKAEVIAEAQAQINAAKEEAEAIHFGIMHKIRTEDAVAAANLRIKSASDRKKALLNENRNALSMAMQGNTSMKKLVLAAAMDQAKIKGKQAIVNAFEFGTKTGGPYLGVAYAAAASVAVGGLISAIGGAGSSGGGGAPSTPADPTTNTGTSSSEESTGAVQSVMINLNGMGYSKENVRDLIESINEELDDGVELKTNLGD